MNYLIVKHLRYPLDAGETTGRKLYMNGASHAFYRLQLPVTDRVEPPFRCLAWQVC